MNLNLAFFDIDGTLIWRKRNDGIGLKSATFNYAVNTVMRLHGVNYLDILGRKIFGLTDKAILKATLLELGFSEDDYYKNEDKLFRAADYYFERELKNLTEFQYNPNPGARELLEILRKQGVRLGLVTGNIEKHSIWKIQGVDFHDYFTTGAFGDDAEDRAEIMSIALKRNIDIPVSSVCHFGDSPPDLIAASQNGIRCVGLTKSGGGTHSREELESVGYGLVVDSWNDIGKIEEYLS